MLAVVHVISDHSADNLERGRIVAKSLAHLHHQALEDLVFHDHRVLFSA